MHNDDERDYAEEEYNRAEMEREAAEERVAEQMDKRNRIVLKARTNIIAENAHMLRDDIQIMTVQEVEDTIASMEQTLSRLRASFNSGDLHNLLRKNN